MNYGDYILSTGGGLATWENVFNRHLYDSRFRGKSPVLEVGPGRCAFIRQDPDHIIGVDNSPELVETYASRGLDIRLGSAYELPFPDDYFEAAFSCWLLEHLHEPQRCLSEVSRALRPNGYACMIVPSVQALLRGFYDDYTHVRPFTKASLHQLGEAAGFSRYSIHYLFWTRGVRRLIPFLGEGSVVRVLSHLDQLGGKVGLMNRYNLVFEAWK